MKNLAPFLLLVAFTAVAHAQQPPLTGTPEHGLGAAAWGSRLVSIVGIPDTTTVM